MRTELEISTESFCIRKSIKIKKLIIAASHAICFASHLNKYIITKNEIWVNEKKTIFFIEIDSSRK